ncbi:flagellar biosynthetic protein FliO [Pseudomonas sp. WS 5059]|jgi:flagellar protein FliO/FliZ|uniref:flagellar biosynthetic protein FliO n=1 Tax=unclassified Pseudomonas TaxID=196821 RepID=UPI001475D86D|nr:MULTISPECIES: flagellar biosynthetic protein FliO [unclassified Pseudomonas]NMX62628.1 flagellar biosynthetic protein FliO [Pseudomonas sp. WS 5079]NMX70268.1 flagellar biosynthetic protein FliO [Pseudomonas sp. WS 5111]NMX87402.1 flagellar biosynthetic protein FliO [Pseudomonas sp. WS 5010]NMY04398.1 flagellar biosynthetic protein FliO [Pseudomonas sp. WS 5059]NMY25239.1 flagellar biosynthetic protein FliO [Pseudomonas sp. WS 5021]
MSRRLLGLLWALPLGVFAAEPVAQVAAPAGGGSVTGQLTQLVLGLLLVVGLIFALAWLLRRVQRIGPGHAQVIELVGSRALGPRDRLVLVQVGEEQILLGLTPGRITPLHVLKHPVSVAQTEAATPEFAQRLMELMGKDQKDKK